MLLASYASDSDSDSDAGSNADVAVGRGIKPAQASASAPGPAQVAAPAPAGPSKKKRPVKITLDLPKTGAGAGAGAVSGGAGDDDEGRASRAGAEGGADADGDADADGAPDAKRVKLGVKGGKGSSSLLGMLPPPKRKLPASASGSAIGSADKKASLAVNRSMAVRSAPSAALGGGAGDGQEEDGEDADGDAGRSDAGPSSNLLPASMARKAQKAKAAEDLDIFGLNTSTPSSALPKPSAPAPAPTSISITSAPSVSAYKPPPPTTNDPYPGYYQLPSGQWAAYDPDEYAAFFSGSGSGAAVDPNAPDIAAGRAGRGWADLDVQGDMLDVRADTGVAQAREEEERRALMKRPKLVSEQIEYSPVGQTKGLAADKHQLSSLLNTAFTQREALEERIAQNKKSSRVARTKYGF